MGVLDDLVRTVTDALDGGAGEDTTRGVPVGVVGPDASYSVMPDAVASYLRMERDFLSIFGDAECMDEYPLAAAVLDIVADDTTQTDWQTGRVLTVTAKTRKYQKIVEDLYKDLAVEDRLWGDVRSLIKYGNGYAEPILADKVGVVRVNQLPPASMRRVEDSRGDLLGFVQDLSGGRGFSENEFKEIVQKYERDAARRKQAVARGRELLGSEGPIPFEPWQVIHARLMGRNPYSLYGSPFLEPARWVWRRMLLMDDAVLRFRLDRAPERYAYYLNVGNKTDQEAWAYVNRFRQQVRKRRYVDSSGRLGLKFDPVAQDEDVFIPIRNGDETRVETLASPVWQSVDDADYFRTLFYAAAKVPRAYMGDETGVVRATLSSQDVRFARVILRVQREEARVLKQLAQVHFAALGIDPYSVDFSVSLTAPSAIFELAQLEVRNARADLATRMREHVSMRWVLSHIFNLTDQEIKTIFTERGDDLQREGGAGPPGGGGGDEDEGPPQEAPTDFVPGPEGIDEPPKGGASQESAPRRSFAGRLRPVPRRITERELLQGSRDAERRAEAKLEKLLRGDAALLARMEHLRSLLHDLRARPPA